MNSEWQTILAALLSTLALGYYFIPPIGAFGPGTSDPMFAPLAKRDKQRKFSRLLP